MWQDRFALGFRHTDGSLHIRRRDTRTLPVPALRRDIRSTEIPGPIRGVCAPRLRAALWLLQRGKFNGERASHVPLARSETRWSVSELGLRSLERNDPTAARGRLRRMGLRAKRPSRFKPAHRDEP